ncbi:hypothetical protein TcWFU_006708 [Taenia crassiceps]|uniref:Uncharacterized protein n=1 Tax=Taenia crassiceps TaxID=6207 RepID=A0ABR4QRD3_9CEST
MRRYMIDSLDAIIEACSDLEEWHFSSTECILPVEPGAALISDVASSKKQRKTFQLDTFLTAKPRLITIELSSLPSPYIEIEVKWLPLTQMDLLTLEKYPVPQGLMKEWDCVSNMEGSSQNLDCAKLLGKQRRQGSTNGREEEHDLDDDLDSMNSDSNGPTQLASYRSSAFHSDHRKPLRAEHNIYFSQASHNQSSDNSIFQQQTMNDEQKEEGFDRSEDTEGDNHCGDTIALEVLLNSVQTKVETINHRPNRYQALLCELSRVLQGLQEQLSSSSDIAANTFQCTNLPVSVDSEVEKSISMLDYVLGDSSAELVPDVGTRTQSLTSGWDQLDSVIQWHLHHVSHLIKHLESSNRFCSSLSHIDKYNNTSLLCINEDLLAMALEAQSEILVDITGLVLNCAEERNPYKIFTNSRCLAFCGTDPRAPLFPATFWSRYVWPTPTFGSGSPGPNETLRPNLMIQRTSLNEYLFQEYDTLDTDDENKQSLDSAIDNLIDKITDLDLMDITVWNEIPLTQLCNRLKLQNFQILLRYNSQNLRLGHPNSRGENSLSRSALNVEPIVSLALKYLIKQGKLQHELRESDEELLFHSLESLVNNLEVQSATADRRSELMALSVDNFICLAHTLEHKDDSVTASARQAICALENLTRSAYGVILQSNPLPFLRTAGPCCAFLKELDVFSQKLRGATSRFKDDSYGRGKTTNSDSGYSLISPVGTAILWAMQCPDTEDYRTAALAAWECFSPPTDMSFSQSSSRPQSYLFNHQPKSSRVTHGTLCGGGDQDPIKAEVRRMNLADDSAKVRRLALRILMSRQKCRSIACSLDTAV